MKRRSAIERMEEPRGEREASRGAVVSRREARSEAGEAGKGSDPPVILAATDGSEVSLRAGEHAVRLAEELGARLVVLYVVDEDAAFHAGIHYGDAVAEFALDGREATAKVASLAAEGGVECREVVVSGNPHRAIVSKANDLAADYIVLGSHGGSAFERAILGSVSAKVLHLAERPVLVVGGGVPRANRAQNGNTGAA